MSHGTLEERVAALESQVGEWLAKQSSPKGVKDWRRTSGAFTDDDLMRAVFEEGRKIRDAERKSAQQRGGPKPRTEK